MNRFSHFIALTALVCSSAPGEASAAPLNRSDEFHFSWTDSPERVWVGPEFWANRLQDWRLHNGRLECVESRRNLPLRTTHLLTHSVSSSPLAWSVEVTTGPVGTEGSETLEDLQEGSFAGFLFGAGNDSVDYRLTAMTHHKPATDGGLLAVVNHLGEVQFWNNGAPLSGGNLWSIAGGLSDGMLPRIQTDASLVAHTPKDPLKAVRLKLTVEPSAADQKLYQVHLEAFHSETGRLLGYATLHQAPVEWVDGGLGLVSHLGSKSGKSGFWFQDWSGSGLVERPERMFGPVLGTQFTQSAGTLKMTVQFPPLGEQDPKSVSLQARPKGNGSSGEWTTLDQADWVPESFTAHFRVDHWEADSDQDYRVTYQYLSSEGDLLDSDYEGVIPVEPDDESFVLAGFTGHKIYTGGLQWNSNGLWFPHQDIINAVQYHQPDFLFFSGDQVYEGDLTPVEYQPTETALLDYHYKWFRWMWAFRDLTRNIPCATVPDDHDVYHGNIWGAGGKATDADKGFGAPAQDSGGYKMSPAFVNAVHATQTSHLPDPVDPAPAEQGISVYFTRVEYGGVSFAVLADRMFKSSPTVAAPQGQYVNGWAKNPEYDPKTMGDSPEAELLGSRQEAFLENWALDWSHGAWMKTVLSQTIFANVATLPSPANTDAVVPSLPFLPPADYPENDIVAADADSNGWPQSGRNRAVRSMRKGFAFHLAGDQHLGSTIQYGVDAWGDAGFALCVPSVANTWPRRWYPPVESGNNRAPGAPGYSGEFEDGFGNRITVHAVSNPTQSGLEPANLHDRAPGYGIVRMNRDTRQIQIECWPRSTDPSKPNPRQYPGWPIRIHQSHNYGRAIAGQLPTIEVMNLENPVFQIINETTGEMEYAIRSSGSTYQPGVFDMVNHTIRVGEPDQDRWVELRHLKPQVSHIGLVRVLVD